MAVLEVEGRLIPDSTEILFELDTLFPNPPLLSPEAMVAEQQRQLEDWTDASFSWLSPSPLPPCTFSTCTASGNPCGSGLNITGRNAVSPPSR